MRRKVRVLLASAEIIEDMNRITLSHQGWEEFVALLDSDAEPTVSAKLAARRYNEFSITASSLLPMIRCTCF